MTENELSAKAEELAAKVMSLSAGTLLLNMRFFAKAVSRLSVQAGGESFSCDGRHMIYEPHYLLERYRQNERLPVHDYLHMLLHCIFRHWHTGAAIHEKYWDAACDIAAEALIMQIGSDFCGNERLDEKKQIIGKLSVEIRPLTAEKIYSYFIKRDVSEAEVNEFISIFCTDDHSSWHKNREPDREYEPEEQPDVIGLGYPDGSDKNDTGGDKNGKGSDDNKEENTPQENDSEKTGQTENGQQEISGENEQTQAEHGDPDDKSLEEWLENTRQSELEQLDEMWKEISKEIQSELENFDKNPGSESRYLTRALGDVNRDKCDYTAFLRRFAVSGEVMKPDTDSFDYNFYTYGLSLYENVALIEPLEYKDVKLVKDFVIAIDTSGSVSSTLVQAFMQKTYSILKSEESFFSKVNIYIIQCDTEIRDAVKITCDAEFEKYITSMEIKGLGGTDFRPVFDYVDELINRREFSSLKGLIYFTDGFGEFPVYRPPYDTAFAFLRSDYEHNEQPCVPPWAIKLILEEEDFFYGR